MMPLPMSATTSRLPLDIPLRGLLTVKSSAQSFSNAVTFLFRSPLASAGSSVLISFSKAVFCFAPCPNTEPGTAKVTTIASRINFNFSPFRSCPTNLQHKAHLSAIGMHHNQTVLQPRLAEAQHFASNPFKKHATAPSAGNRLCLGSATSMPLKNQPVLGMFDGTY